MANPVLRLRHPLGFACAVSDGGKGAFDGICCPDMLPVLGWEVVERRNTSRSLVNLVTALSYFTP